jgi:hypothetical protein
MVFKIDELEERDLNFKLNRINWLDQEITRYRDYEWTATSVHTAFFVAILYLLINPETRLGLMNAIGSKILLGLPISLYFIIACYQLIDIHIKLNRNRNERTKFLNDIGEPKGKEITKCCGFYEGKAAFSIISFIFWLIILFAFDLFLLYKNAEGVVMSIIISLIIIKAWVTIICHNP